MDELMKKKAEYPSEGIFYMVPDVRSGKYTLYVQRQDQNENEVAHFLLWDKVVELLGIRFRKARVELLESAYLGLPRGRVIQGVGKEWVVGWGEDFPLGEFRDEIIKEFSLGDVQVRFEKQMHETMSRRDQKNVENVLGIKMSPSGFKVK